MSQLRYYHYFPVFIVMAFTYWNVHQKVKHNPSSSPALLANDAGLFLGLSLDPALPVKPPPFDNEETLEEARTCLNDHPQLQSLVQKKNFSLQDFKNLQKTEATFDQINVHFKSDGKPFRIMLLNEKGEGPKENVRLFAVGSDNLPTRMDLPEEWKDKTQLEVFQIIKASKQITNMQKHIRWQIDESTTFSFYDESGILRDLMITLKDKTGQMRTLGCKLNSQMTIKCKCILAPGV